jgi:uncharacterized membrane protein
MKKYFITGLALLLPVVFTAMIFLFVVNLLTKPFIGIVEQAFAHYGLLGKPIFFLTSTQIINFFSRFLILIALFLVTVLIGFLGKIVIFHYFIRIGDYIIHKIPLVNKIYKATQDVIETIFKDKKANFSQVVLIPFPTSNTLCIGLVTNDPQTHQPLEDKQGNISVFVPATPNPTIGFVLLYKRSQMTVLDISVEEGLKFVVSCGVMSPKFNTPKEADLAINPINESL